MSPIDQSAIGEPNASDSVEKSPKAIAHAYYAFSTLLCTPASLSPNTGLALGPQAAGRGFAPELGD